MPKSIIDFSRLTDTELDQQAENILTKMTGNETFPTPDPDLSVLESDLLNYRASMVTAALGDKHQIVLKNQKRAQLEWTMRAIGLYVDRVAKRDSAVILSAGFAVPKLSLPVGPCPKATDVAVAPGEIGSGIAGVKVKRHHSARMYRFEYRLHGTEAWTWLLSSRSRIQLAGLQSFQRYEFRAAYIGTDPTVTYSDVVTGYVV